MSQTNQTRRAGGAAGLGNALSIGVDSTENAPNHDLAQAEIISPLVDKKRFRITKTGLKDRRAALHDIVEKAKPCTVRQVFYLATVRGLVAKDETGYSRVKTDLADMREAGELPYEWLADHTRWQRRPTTWGGISEALEDTAETYRKALWRNLNSYVEIWLEKDALSGVILPITKKFDVPLMVARGYSSITFLHSSGSCMREVGKPCYIYHLGDFDPSGQDAARCIEKGLRKYSGDAEIHFERIAVTPQQITDWDLPTRPTKQSDTRAKKFGEISVELDAIDPNALRALVNDVIERHLPPEEYKVLMAAEESEKKLFEGLAGLVKQLGASKIEGASP